MDRKQFLTLGLAGIVGKAISSKKDELKKFEDREVLGVQEGELAVKHGGNIYNQSYEIIFLKRSVQEEVLGKNMVNPFEVGKYVVFSDTPIKKGDKLSFTYTPEKRVTVSEVEDYLSVKGGMPFQVLERINLSNINGVIADYSIKPQTNL